MPAENDGPQASQPSPSPPEMFSSLLVMREHRVPLDAALEGAESPVSLVGQGDLYDVDIIKLLMYVLHYSLEGPVIQVHEFEL